MKQSFYIGSVLTTLLTRVHTLTLDAVVSGDESGTIDMYVAVLHLKGIFVASLSFNEFYYLRMLLSSDLTPANPALLSSLRAPLDLWISSALLVVGLLICLIIAASSGGWSGAGNYFRLPLWYCMPLASEEPKSGAGPSTVFYGL